MEGEKIKKILIKIGPVRLALLLGCAIALAMLSDEQGKNTDDHAQTEYQSIKNENDDKTDAQDIYAKKLEECLSYAEGIGEVKVMITFKEKEVSSFSSEKYLPEVEGVLIIVKGGDDAKIKSEITDAAKVLFGLEAHKIKVMKMK